MTKETDARRFVWRSDAKSVHCGTVSVLAIVETLAASAFGVWLWFQWGLYPLLLSSAVMAFLTMLRSPASVELGARWFQAYEEGDEDIPLTGWKGICIIGASALMSFALIYWIAEFWLPLYSGWAHSWRAALLGILSMNIVLAAAGAGAGAAALALAAALAAAAALAGVAALATAGAVLIFPGIALGVFFSSHRHPCGGDTLPFTPGNIAICTKLVRPRHPCRCLD